MNGFILSIFGFFVLPVLKLILFIFFAYVIVSWLFTFQILKMNNPTARQIYSILSSVVEPIVAPFRRIIPPLGQFDMGFFFAFMAIYWIANYLIPGVIMPALA